MTFVILKLLVELLVLDLVLQTPSEPDEDAELFREVGVVLEKLSSTSSLPPTLQSCLVVNRTYQEIIEEHMRKIDLELAENREAQVKSRNAESLLSVNIIL